MQRFVEDLALPELLLSLIEAGIWPRTSHEAGLQNSQPRVSRERLAALAPEEQSIYFYPPPFTKLATMIAKEAAGSFSFYRQFGAIDQINPQVAVELGDFGLGSDAPFILDYRDAPQNPAVLRLHWPGEGKPNRWVLLAPDFPTFATALGLLDAR